jgi:hypothetical protein
MDLAPVAHQRKNQQHERDQQQPGSFRRVDRVAVMMLVIVRGRIIRHANIVAPTLVRAVAVPAKLRRRAPKK